MAERDRAGCAIAREALYDPPVPPALEPSVLDGGWKGFAAPQSILQKIVRLVLMKVERGRPIVCSCGGGAAGCTLWGQEARHRGTPSRHLPPILTTTRRRPFASTMRLVASPSFNRSISLVIARACRRHGRTPIAGRRPVVFHGTHDDIDANERRAAHEAQDNDRRQIHPPDSTGGDRAPQRIIEAPFASVSPPYGSPASASGVTRWAECESAPARSC